jgi:ankyrin repeat protein
MASQGELSRARAKSSRALVEPPSAKEARDRQLAFFAAASAGDGPALTALCAGPTPAALESVDAAGMTALMLAARGGWVAAVSALLLAGASVSARARGARPPLHWAAAANHADVVSVLLAAAGCDAGAADDDGFTALHLAAAAGHAAPIAVLLAVAASADVRSARVNARTRSRLTPLMLAADHGFIDCVRALLAGGADAALVSDIGFTCVLCGRCERTRCPQRITPPAASASDAHAPLLPASSPPPSALKLARFAGHLALALELSKVVP